MQSINIEPGSPRHPGVMRLLALSDAYMKSLYPAESNHMLPIDELEVANVSFFVASKGNSIKGCAALVRYDDGSAEIKRMFVDEQARGLKVGQQLLEALETEAIRYGAFVIRLETGILQPEAIGLYRKSGFVEIGPFGSYRKDPLSIFMEKRL